jgi:hypothetical protein
MIRSLVAVVLGALLAFAWAFGGCMLMPWHGAGMRPVPEEEPLRKSLKEQLPESAVYMMPNPPTDYVGSPEAAAAWEEKLRQGPAMILFYQRDGIDGMNPLILVYGIAFNGIAAIIAVWLLRSIPGRSYLGRLFVVLLLPIFTTMTSHLVTFQYGFTPVEYALGNAADLLTGWLIAGLVMAALVKAPLPIRPTADS